MLNGLVAREKHTEAAGKACKERVLCRAPIHPASDVLKYFYFSEAHGPNFMRALFLISFPSSPNAKYKSANSPKTKQNSLAADHLVLVVLAREDLQRRLDDAAAQAEHKVQRRLLLDVVVRERAAVLELLSGEDEALLVRGDAWRGRGRCVCMCVWEGGGRAG
jgi:hypothetical protein